MTDDVASHELTNWLRDLDCEKKNLVLGLLASATEDPGFGKLIMGMLLAFKQEQHGICVACQENHDEALVTMSGQDKDERARKEEIKAKLQTDKWTPTGSINPLTTQQTIEMHRYGLDDLRAEEDYELLGFVCKGCGMKYQSVEDRMLKLPGKEGCDGCIQKEKWG